MEPIIVLNLKVYKEATGKRCLELCHIVNEVSLVTGVPIIVCPPMLDLKDAVSTGSQVFGQHADAVEPGANTGRVTLEAIEEAGAKGTLINHAERKLTLHEIGKLVEKCRKLGLVSLVCTANSEESAACAALRPNYIAVEPPELIGTGVSVSTAKPEVVTSSVKAVKRIADVPVLCGAGISNAEDVKKAIELGSDGVLLASAFVKAEDPKAFLLGLAKASKR